MRHFLLHVSYADNLLLYILITVYTQLDESKGSGLCIEYHPDSTVQNQLRRISSGLCINIILTRDIIWTLHLDFAQSIIWTLHKISYELWTEHILNSEQNMVFTLSKAAEEFHLDF
jgi:hypothetical protein